MLNTFTIHGRLVRDPNVRYTAGENSMCIARFTIGVSRIGRDSESDYPQITAFGKLAERIEKYCKKGTEVIVIGKIQTGSYVKGGEKVYTQELVAESFDFCGTKSKEDGIAPPNGFNNVAPNEEIPF